MIIANSKQLKEQQDDKSLIASVITQTSSYCTLLVLDTFKIDFFLIFLIYSVIMRFNYLNEHGSGDLEKHLEFCSERPRIRKLIERIDRKVKASFQMTELAPRFVLRKEGRIELAKELDRYND